LHSQNNQANAIEIRLPFVKKTDRKRCWECAVLPQKMTLVSVMSRLKLATHRHTVLGVNILQLSQLPNVKIE